VLAGHSMGGMAIMALAERHPALVAARAAGVALVATTSGGMTDLDLGLPGRRGQLVARGEHVIVPLAAHLGGVRAGVGSGRTATPTVRAAAIAPVIRALVFGRHPRRADVLSVAEQALAAHPPSVAAFRASIGEHRRTEALAALAEVPVTVLVGDRDRLCPRRHSDVIADALPAASVALYPGAGHMITFERAPEVAAHVRGLLDRAAAVAATPSEETVRAGDEAELSSTRDSAVPA
jgi:pimeloyl-ACP methyl ester carboxylesterase